MPVRFRVNGRDFQAAAFLFDKDGTLITFDHWFLVMEERAQRLVRELGLSHSQGAALAKFMGVGNNETGDWGIIPLPRPEAEDATARFLCELVGGCFVEIFPVVQRIFADVDRDFPFDNHIKPTPGAEELLLGIKRAGGKVGIVTHDLAAAAWLHIRALGWERLVDAVVGLDLCPVKKPAPEPVRRACGLLGLPAREGVMVGDTQIDLAAGRAAGCSTALGVLTGLGTYAELAPHADAVLPNLRGIELRG
ncbi:MAG: HAD family hydrolase [Candidatus Bipolaricaulota bacterium]|nr:HAD family hydrolase [Candidatus Bipolaricaulota bacterium]MDW8126683.1 HAD family hydrolase [Candidatus Bipolaricaulota bacterium]